MKLTSKIRSLSEAAIMFAVDMLVLAACYKVAVYARTDLYPLFISGFPEHPPTRSVLAIWWLFLPWVFFMAYEGLYTRRFAFWDEVKALWLSVFLASVGIFTLTSLGKQSGQVSRTVVLTMALLAFAALPVIRITVKHHLRRWGLMTRRAMILGAGNTGRIVAKALDKEPNYGYNLVGFLDDDPAKVGTKVGHVRVHGGVDFADRYLKRARIDTLIVAMPGAGRQRIQELINRYQHKVESVLLVPDILGMAVLGTRIQHFFEEQAFALEVQNNLASPVNYFTKRAFDYTVGLALTLVLLVPFAVLCAIIRLTSPGPAIYRHKRMGKRGKEFYCFKFRTMYADADKRLKEILESSAEARREWQGSFKLKDDPRVTPIGAFLRRTSLDELPQMLNLLAGDMSLVGPRPVVRQEIELYYKDLAGLCFSVTPGITGLWQVSGRSNTSYEYRVALDSWYVRNWNLWLDIVILFKTVKVVFRREGAY